MTNLQWIVQVRRPDDGSWRVDEGFYTKADAVDHAAELALDPDDVRVKLLDKNQEDA